MKFLKNFMIKRKNPLKKPAKKLVTHDGSFHADDILAVATLAIYLENQGEIFEIIRTRDEGIINGADYVFDVGGVYDPTHNRFDHHQRGGVGEREGIPYAAFGLVWKKFGLAVAGAEEIARLIERKLVMGVDANDNGVNLWKNNFTDILPYTLQDVFATFSPTALEIMTKDDQFLKALQWGTEILKREIKKTNDQIEVTKIIRNFYEKTEDKRLIVINEPKVSRFEIWDALQDFPEPVFVVYGDNLDWSVVTMRQKKNSFGSRKDFPANWGGISREELQKITKVPDAVFCHRSLFLAVAKSKNGAIKLAQLALSQ